MDVDEQLDGEARWSLECEDGCNSGWVAAVGEDGGRDDELGFRQTTGEHLAEERLEVRLVIKVRLREGERERMGGWGGEQREQKHL